MKATSSSEPIRIEFKDQIIHIELNRPHVLNAMNVELIEQLNEKLVSVTDHESKIILVFGAGAGFSSGGDITSMNEDISETRFTEIMEQVKEMIVKVYTLPKVVISAVHGPAAGLGFSLSLASDYIVASEDASFGLNFIKIGLVADGGCHYLLKNKLGDQVAKQAILNGRTFNAEEAFQLGLIDKVVADQPFTHAEEIAKQFLKQPIEALIETKMIFNSLNVTELIKTLDMENVAQGKMRKTLEHQRRIQAFLNK
ncbi:enoyl-CoA hydratase-related protein [Pseudalkalibacillus salsuginis]|uniref:enoyl-CoA hydratase-related protein n=1 Tax=Pseudalkalibacillus salsuginis TaxID=2910972 RepID=UPI001F255789|nr:enoyl-CoA hydratase-related protein [Pseudalkalibacillus salsuginis]MCF6408952.1 enoyl-CoA hydratase-related protein [Pseudalkalibacillus salsuginis]